MGTRIFRQWHLRLFATFGFNPFTKSTTGITVNVALLVKLWRVFEGCPLLLVMTENHQTDLPLFDQIQQVTRTSTDRFGFRA